LSTKVGKLTQATWNRWMANSRCLLSWETKRKLRKCGANMCDWLIDTLHEYSLLKCVLKLWNIRVAWLIRKCLVYVWDRL